MPIGPIMVHLFEPIWAQYVPYGPYGAHRAQLFDLFEPVWAQWGPYGPYGALPLQVFPGWVDQIKTRN